MKARIALFIDEFVYEDPGRLIILQIGFNIGVELFSPNVEKQMKYTTMRVNNAAIYTIPFISEFEMLSMIKNVDNRNDPEIESILNMLDKDRSIPPIILNINIYIIIYIIL